MKIFITGASGYIGLSVSQALRRAGHEVWGLARTEAKALLLSKHEILPVIGTMQEPRTFLEVAVESSAIIHLAMDYQSDTWTLDQNTVQLLLDLGGSTRRKFIYTSGVWVYGDTGSKPANELTPVNPPMMVKSRPDIEEDVLRHTSVRPLVIRPGMVYGMSGGIFGSWFASAMKSQPPVIVGNGENFWSMVHVDDLAEAYVHAIESNLSGEIMNVTDRSRWRVRDLATSASKAAGYYGAPTQISLDDAVETMGPLAECLALDQHVDSRKAVRLLDWQPKHGGFVDEADTYFAAWQASQK